MQLQTILISTLAAIVVLVVGIIVFLPIDEPAVLQETIQTPASVSAPTVAPTQVQGPLVQPTSPQPQPTRVAPARRPVAPNNVRPMGKKVTAPSETSAAVPK